MSHSITRLPRRRALPECDPASQLRLSRRLESAIWRAAGCCVIRWLRGAAPASARVWEVDKVKPSRPGAPRLRAVRSAQRVPRSVFVANTMNLELIRLAVDFQDLADADASVASARLEALRAATNVDAACLVLLDEEGASAKQVTLRTRRELAHQARTPRSTRRSRRSPGSTRASGTSAVLELLDTTIVDRETEAEGDLFHRCGISAVLLIGFSRARSARRFPRAVQRRSARRLGREPAPPAQAPRQQLRARRSSGGASSATSRR